MSFWSAIVLIVAIIAFTEMVKARHRSRKGDAPEVTDSEYGREAQREIEDLRERIKVLERIATEGNTLDTRETQRISAEIEALRDRQAD
ncbi:hypothetical protein [Erythrobacter mangrovi]|uniref:Uncharacterized protein n=1 Tax=Erythrobacter mangrovi TaxID=2739433 RepID=A0A7D4BI01_9SPHN|nr:hypothetical protein [Erythrobacter mangrovi]QKG72522.1 hypothetical protein HQR01_14730 [Erythrobacter mangrovi]